ncbi:MAG: methanogenesis marker 3 protein [Methanomicrobiales archaeon]|nr:methanogenesis marker 3 protein [Methanomicrobiales archaeon]
MQIHLDGKLVEVPVGSTLAELIPDRDPRCSVAVIRPAPEKEEKTPFIRIVTNRGEVIVEAIDLESSIPELIGEGHLRVQWVDRYAVAFGPFRTDMKPARKSAPYDRGDVILGCGGYDPSRSLLVFSRIRHIADHGGAEGGGILGRVVSGRGVLDIWESGDRIERIERVVRWEDRTMSFTTTDGGFMLEDGMQLITHIRAIAEGVKDGEYNPSVARSVDHFLHAVQEGIFHVDRATSTYIRSCTISSEEVELELKRPRREGSITVRTEGGSEGCIYIHRIDIPSSLLHTMVGQVTHGIELVKLAQQGETICIRAAPTYLDFIGMTVREAGTLADANGVTPVPDAEDPERLVIAQSPETTLEILASRTVALETAPEERIVAISIADEEAPMTAQVFRDITGLRYHRIGRMPIFFKFEDTILFKPEMKSRLSIMPENTPEGEVPALSLGMTNEARRGAGMVGVRMTDNSEFGPTGEPFEGTNIIGRVLEPEKLQKFKEKEIVYIREAVR